MSVKFINGDSYLTADELLEGRKGQHKAVIISTVDDDGNVDTYASSGLTKPEYLHAARNLVRDIEHLVYEGEFLGE